MKKTEIKAIINKELNEVLKKYSFSPMNEQTFLNIKIDCQLAILVLIDIKLIPPRENWKFDYKITFVNDTINLSYEDIDEPWFVYILECINSSFYIGATKDVAKRYEQHISGCGARYTKIYTPLQVLVSYKLKNQSEALSFEYRLKQLTKVQKIKLVNQDYQSVLFDYDIISLQKGF